MQSKLGKPKQTEKKKKDQNKKQFQLPTAAQNQSLQWTFVTTKAIRASTYFKTISQPLLISKEAELAPSLFSRGCILASRLLER